MKASNAATDARFPIQNAHLQGPNHLALPVENAMILSIARPACGDFGAMPQASPQKIRSAAID
jgi:hypothetical protein